MRNKEPYINAKRTYNHYRATKEKFKKLYQQYQTDYLRDLYIQYIVYQRTLEKDCRDQGIDVTTLW